VTPRYVWLDHLTRPEAKVRIGAAAVPVVSGTIACAERGQAFLAETARELVARIRAIRPKTAA